MGKFFILSVLVNYYCLFLVVLFFDKFNINNLILVCWWFINWRYSKENDSSRMKSIMTKTNILLLLFFPFSSKYPNNTHTHHAQYMLLTHTYTPIVSFFFKFLWCIRIYFVLIFLNECFFVLTAILAESRSVFVFYFFLLCLFV